MSTESMTPWAKLESGQNVVLLISNEKHYKIYRNRIIAGLGNARHNLYVFIPDGWRHKNEYQLTDSHLDDWLKLDSPTSKVIWYTARLGFRPKWMKLLHRSLQGLLTLRFHRKLCMHYPAGFNNFSIRNQQRIRFVGGLLLNSRTNQLRKVATTWLLKHHVKAKIDRDAEAVLKTAALVVASFPTADKSSLQQNAVLFRAQQLNIPTTHLVASWDNLTNRVPSSISRPSTIGVWSQWQALQAVRLWDYSPQDVYFCPPAIPVLARTGIRQKTQSEIPVIGYLGSSSGIISREDEITVIRSIGKLLNLYAKQKSIPKIFLKVRFHPLPHRKMMSDKESTSFGIKQITTEQFDSIEVLIEDPKSFGGTVWRPSDIEQLHTYLGGLDVAIGLNTSLMVESMAGGVPTIGIPINVGEPVMMHSFHLWELITNDIFPYASDEYEFMKYLDFALFHPTMFQHRISSARKFIGMFGTDE